MRHAKTTLPPSNVGVRIEALDYKKNNDVVLNGSLIRWLAGRPKPSQQGQFRVVIPDAARQINGGIVGVELDSIDYKPNGDKVLRCCFYRLRDDWRRRPVRTRRFTAVVRKRAA